MTPHLSAAARALSAIPADLADVLRRALDGRELSPADAGRLLSSRGFEIEAIAGVADEVRRRQVGDVATYVVNRNVNFTNVCIKRCTFCAFSRGHRTEEAYFLPVEEIVRRAAEAAELGATEVCIQAGLAPKIDGRFYVDLVRALRRELPEMHLHAFSPEEILYGAVRMKVTIREFLEELRAAGLHTLPGTSAEILDQEVRDRIAPGRITRDQWLEVVTNAHDLGIRTTATIMYGHVESVADRVAHLALLRDVQKETGGFTEFVPLSFIPHEAPMVFRNLVPEARPGATADESVLMHATGRLFLGATFRNVQASWVKEGPAFSSWLLGAGANDLGGTLINESISTTAGAAFGQIQRPRELRALIRRAGRVPAQRNTVYDVLAAFGEGEDAESALDQVENAEERFGSYRQLAASDRFRFRHPSGSASLGDAR